MKKPTPFGKYFLLERINVGGMAEVFRAKAFGVEGFERLVAVKRILPNIAEDKEFIRMFIEEAKLSVQLNHANIAQIFDLGVVDGAYYIALEHVHGRDLRGIFDRCRNLGEPMPVAQACFVCMKVCEGLDYAHNKRDQSGRELSLVHRDVSPQNMLVSFEGEVKLIDFGIAKAAGKGSKTQAGILKGKFGYMSPEQVRGLPIDRRSDVFSAGIVLYELLTGERLFVGESDFSTLEKVRNVEILPPSTYNRKIPDELERIVLKALAKDVEDRYQNAIDLHDELQAFVYTAGEFYSRKDLAGWMKKTFAKEIEDETAKLESYRQLKPPPATPEPPRAATGSKPPTATAPPPPRKSTQSIPVVGGGTKPPPPPTRMTGQMAAVGAVKMTGQMAAVSAPAAQSSGKLAPMAAAASPPSVSLQQDPTDLAWDDDELETQIYDNPEDDPKSHKKNKGLPLQAPMHTPSPHMVAASSPNDPTAMAPAITPSPDLSTLAHTAKGWEKAPASSPPPSMSPGATLNGIGLVTGTNGVVPKLATGSNNTVTPLEAPPATSSQLAATMVPAASGYPFDQPRESQVSQRLVATEAPNLFDPMASFGASIAARRPVGQQKNFLWIAGGGIAIAAVAVVLVIVLSSSSDKSKAAQPSSATAVTAATDQPASNPVSTSSGSGPGSTTAAATQPGSNPPSPPVAQVGDQNTGFDLYVTPAGVTQWHLDGETRTDRLPSRIRGIAPGVHTVAIDAPPGFVGGSQQVPVEAGKSGKIEITLQPIENLTGVFDSTPPGAEVSLIVDGKRQALGPTPAKSKLDPRNTYQVLFEKPGYVSVNRPIVFTGSTEEKLVVNLEKASPVVADRPRPTPPVNRPAPPVRQNPVTTPDKGTGPVADKGPDKPPESPATGGMGTVRLGSKPPCEIYVDGAAIGFSTPHPIQVAAGKHRITLVNNEFGIKETFNVDVKADSNELVRKDFSDRLPK